ncbi:MAG: LysM peptidoglycan-binding domain-containing M23 family metallopeptidase [Novosphingobium sp.]|nr:LysM peptidoglycan-binding domain-containing M23 family metallopeptidase [Novosphingobium sp.]
MRTLRLLLAGPALLAGAGLAEAAPGEMTEHVVKPGETLNGIAQRAGVPASSIIKANGLVEPYVIRVGQKLKIPRKGQAASSPGAAGTAARTAVAMAASAPAIGPGPETHVVAPGDTLLGIALARKVPQVLIAEANGLKPPYTIRIGQRLLIPRTRRHTVAEGDTGFAIAYRYAVPWASIAIANGIDPAAPLRVGQQLLIPTVLDTPDSGSAAASAPAGAAMAATSRFAWPLAGPIRRGFIARGSASWHDGLDIEAPAGSPVRAAAAGSVIFAGREQSQFGNLVVIDHGNGWHSAYGSLERVTVRKGDRVAQGERVGLVGNTSVTGRTELHFELRKAGKPVDPLSHLPASE